LRKNVKIISGHNLVYLFSDNKNQINSDNRENIFLKLEAIFSLLILFFMFAYLIFVA